jgi:hypothetical protein
MRRFTWPAPAISGTAGLLLAERGIWLGAAVVVVVALLAVLIITDDKRNGRARAVIRELGRLRRNEARDDYRDTASPE